MANFNQNIDFRLGATDAASPVFRNVETSLDRVQAAYTKLAGALGVGLSVGYFTSLVKASIDAADHLRDLGKSTGIAVEELAGLQLLARQTGTDLDGLAKGINRMSVEMGKDPEKFRALGITATSNKEAFKQFADIFNLLPDIQQRNALAQAVFAKSWAEMAPALSEGGKKIGEVIEKGARLSGITKEMTDRADEFNDKWVELTSTGGLMTRLVGPLLPLLITLVDDMLDAQNQAVSLNDIGFEPLVETLRAVVILAGTTSFTLKGVGTEMGALAAQIMLADSALRKFKSLDFVGAAEDWRQAFGKGGIGDMVTADAEKSRAAFDAWEKKILEIGKLAREPKDNWDLMGKRPDSAAAAAAAARAAAFLTEKKALKEVESAYPGMIKALEEKLLLDKQSTEVEKLMFALDHLRGDQYEKLTIAQLANLEATAHSIDLKNQDAAATKALLEGEEFFANLRKEADKAESERQNVIGQAILATSKQIDQMNLETSLIGKTNVERETAIFLRQAEIDKIDAATIARGKEAIAAKHAAEESKSAQVGFWQSVESAGHQAFLSIFDTSKSVLERIRDMLKTHLIDILYQITFKKWIVQIVTTTSGAGVAQSAFGSTGAASSMGGIGNLFSGMGSFASGISGVASAADWSSIGGAAAGATGIVDSVFQTMGVKLGSQFLADIGNFNWGVPVLSGVVMALSGNVSGGIGSTIGGIAGSYFGPIGTAVGSFLGGMLGSALGGGGGHSAYGTGYRIAGNTMPTGFAGSFIGLSASDEAQYQNPLGDQSGWTSYLNTRLTALTTGMDQLGARLGAPAGTLSGKSFNVDVTGPLDMPQVVQMALASVAQQMAEELVPNLKDYRQENEALDATLNRLIGDLDAVRIVFDALGNTTTVTVETSERLIAVFGGLANLQKQFQTYYDAFYSDAERLALTQKQLHDSFALLNLTEPTTRAGFRALVESLDLTTAAGALTFKALMDIAPAFDQVAKAAEAAGLVVLNLAERISAAQADSLKAVEDQIRASQSAADTARSAAESYRQITTSLADAVRQLRGGDLSPLMPGQKLAEARSNLDTVYGQAATGDATALASLPQAATAFLEASRAYNASSGAYTADFDMVMQLLGQAGIASTAMANVQDYQATLLQTQTGVLEAIKAQLELPSPDAAILAQQAGLLETIAGLLQEQTTQIVTGNGMQALLMQDQTGRIILANAIATDQTGQIVLGHSLLTASSALAQGSAAQLLAGTYLVRDEVGNLLNVSVDQTGRISDVAARIGAGIDIRSAAVIGSYLDAVSASFTGNNTAEASAVRAAIAVLRQTTADGLIAAAEALPTRGALATLQSSTGALLAQSLVVDSAAALSAVERATAIVQATTGLQGAIGAQTGTLLAGTYSVIDPHTGQLVGLTVDQSGQIAAGNSLLTAANAAQGVIQSLLNGQTAQIVGGNLILRDQSGLIVSSNEILQDQAGTLALANTLVGAQTTQIVTGNAIQDAVRNITALNSNYSEEILRAFAAGANTQNDSLQGILNETAVTVSLLRQLVDLAGQDQAARAAAAAAEQAAAAERALQQQISQATAAYEAQKAISDANLAALQSYLKEASLSPVLQRDENIPGRASASYGFTYYSQAQLDMVRQLDAAYGTAFMRAADLFAAIPGHAAGLSYVPRDDYLMRGHQGEAVIDAGTMSALRGYGINVSTTGIDKADIDRLCAAVKEARDAILYAAESSKEAMREQTTELKTANKDSAREMGNTIAGALDAKALA